MKKNTELKEAIRRVKAVYYLAKGEELTNAHIAEATGFSVLTVCQWSAGKTFPSKRAMNSFERIYGKYLTATITLGE